MEDIDLDILPRISYECLRVGRGPVRQGFGVDTVQLANGTVSVYGFEDVI